MTDPAASNETGGPTFPISVVKTTVDGFNFGFAGFTVHLVVVVRVFVCVPTRAPQLFVAVVAEPFDTPLVMSAPFPGSGTRRKCGGDGHGWTTLPLST